MLKCGVWSEDFAADPLAQSPYLPKGACLSFQSSGVFFFLPRVLPFPDQILTATPHPKRGDAPGPAEDGGSNLAV